MRRIAIIVILTTCGACERNLNAPAPGLVLAGDLQNPAIQEASGLTRSHRDEKLLWTINDGGSPPILYAIGTDGSDQGSVQISNATNVDWEDIASYEIDGKSWLIVADVGDNENAREDVTLYIVEEPLPSQENTAPAKAISFVYPDGPRDAEAIAVDVEQKQILVLSKRTVPAVLYAVPLNASPDKTIIATRLGEVSSIPQPGKDDVFTGNPGFVWHWQPTSMDISADGHSAVILSYSALYQFEKAAGESWIDAMQFAPVRADHGSMEFAEAITFSKDGDSIFITSEKQNPPLLRLDLHH